MMNCMDFERTAILNNTMLTFNKIWTPCMKPSLPPKLYPTTCIKKLNWVHLLDCTDPGHACLIPPYSDFYSAADVSFCILCVYFSKANCRLSCGSDTKGFHHHHVPPFHTGGGVGKGSRTSADLCPLSFPQPRSIVGL